jgi:chromosome segregation protein
VFENPPVGGKRMLSIDFDEVSVERVVNRDGTNNYILNNSPVRLRDVSGLLAQANIGSTGHHIISQGEADRVLSSSSKERREMMEDALGLTSYLYKREEAERKLQKTGENMREVEALRRELGPHLKFLSTQVKKIEESEALRGELKEKYLEYLRRESVYTKATENELKEEFEAPMREREMLDKKVEYLKNELSKKGKDNAGAQEIINLEVQGRRARERRDALAREVGRIEGELAVHESLSQLMRQRVLPSGP